MPSFKSQAAIVTKQIQCFHFSGENKHSRVSTGLGRYWSKKRLYFSFIFLFFIFFFFFFFFFFLLSKYVYCIYSNCNSSQDVAVFLKFGVYNYNKKYCQEKEKV